MKIAIVCHASAGGSGVVATELALALSELGHEVHVLSAERPFRLTDKRLNDAGPTVLRSLGNEPEPKSMLGRLVQAGRKSVRNWLARIMGGSVKPERKLHFHEILSADYPLFGEALTPLTTANSLAELIAKYEIQIVHVHYAIPFATSALLARDMGHPVKVVTTLHGTDVTLVGLDSAFAATTKHAILNSDAATAVSRSLAEDARAHLGVDRPIEVIHNWVDAERFKPCDDPERRSRFAQPDEKIILHVSNFRPIKRPQDAVRIFAKVAAALPARLLMIGQGPEREACIQLAKELQVEGRVQFIEFTPEIEQYMSVADLFVLPSESESFGLVALEAMSAGVPVVASNVGGLPEVVVDGLTGCLRPVGDVDGMASAAIEILNDRQKHGTMRRAGRERALSEFRPEAIVPKYLDLYRRVLKQEAQAARQG